ncbi:MAG: gliding motility-associated C-terminal domain-containing protein [Bacteroidota bacterium]
MDTKDQIKDLFAEKLGQMEVPVRPEIWSAISSQVATGSASVGAGISIVSKIVIGISVVAATAVTGIYLLKESSLENATKQDMKEVAPLVSNETSSKPEESLMEVQVENKSNENHLQNQADLVKEVPYFEEISYKEEFAINEPLYVYESKPNKEVVPMKVVPTETLVENEIIINSPVNDPVVNEIEFNDQRSTVDLMLPNTFTPNGDRSNDELFIVSEGLTDFTIIVLDQSNKVVYQSTDSQFKWDGTDQSNNPVAGGNYVYYITALDAKGKKVSKFSTLRIAR